MSSFSGVLYCPVFESGCQRLLLAWWPPSLFCLLFSLSFFLSFFLLRSGQILWNFMLSVRHSSLSECQLCNYLVWVLYKMMPLSSANSAVFRVTKSMSLSLSQRRWMNWRLYKLIVQSYILSSCLSQCNLNELKVMFIYYYTKLYIIFMSQSVQF